ncbi:conserved hypothetical protein [Echinococcus multilocularis]|uniref:Uncharacterized protein n=1 Tax=Echinococcus multilocularis TaxID=6211 RepID=A0A068Y6W1_ECHMU|nr:conserved hypothetical protein [Echinococcus multilocularis]
MKPITSLFSTCGKWASENTASTWKLEAEDCHLPIGQRSPILDWLDTTLNAITRTNAHTQSSSRCKRACLQKWYSTVAMLNGAATATVSLAPTSNLAHHITEIHAILNNNSGNEIHPSRFTDDRGKPFISPSTATLTSDSSGSPITVLLTNGREEDRDVTSRISGDDNGRREQTPIPSAARNRPGFSPPCPLSGMSQPSRVVQQSRQETPSIHLLKRLKTTLWIDRALLLLGVILPLTLGICFFLVHSFTDFASCRPIKVIVGSTNKFVNQVCRSKLIQVILQGAKDADNEERITGSLQHECFPIILILIALLNWIPHLCWRLAIRHSVYRDASLVASELRSFRKTAQRELISIASSISTVPLSSNFMPMIQEIRLKGSTRPTPTQRRSSDETTLTEPLESFQIPKMENTVSPVDTGYESEMDLPSAAVMHLPRLRVSRDDHALNIFLAGWQNTDFYIRRFIAKHTVLALFNATTFLLVLGFSVVTYGEPFSGSFYCRPTEKSTTLHICLASTTFALNMTAFCLGALGLAGLICSGVFFYQNFSHIRVYSESTLACGTQFDLQSDLAASLVSRREENFFADYIRLLALARMQQRGSLFVARRDVFNLRLSYLPGLTRADFHFINLLCKENCRYLPDAMQLRVWLLRYVFLCRRLGPRVFGRSVSTPNNNLRSEDLSTRLGFSKVRIRVDICDQFC